jgi:hypothetical protein
MKNTNETAAKIANFISLLVSIAIVVIVILALNN